MSFTKGFLYGVVSSMTLTSPPLYRYPYRNSIEAFRSDWKHIGKDIEAAQYMYGASPQGDTHE